MKIDLKGKVAVVTGSARGIGKGIAAFLAQNGARVVICDVLDEDGRKTEAQISQTGDCRYFHLNVADRQAVEQFIDGIARDYGRIDIFVNNAGVNIPGKKRKDVDQFPLDEWEKIYKVDVDGLFYCCQCVSHVMIKQKSGRIINIGSVFGHVPARKQIAFVGAKAAVHNMTKGMALELAPHGILVNAIAPGSILTEGTKDLFYSDDADQKEFRERMLSHVPLGRPGDTDDIANAVLFLSGEESKYMTGHVMIIDGGWTCGYTRDF